MKVVKVCFFFTCFVTYAFCAVISETKKDEVISLQEPFEDCVLDGEEDVPVNTLFDVDGSPIGGKKLISSKKKRCPR